MSRPQHLTGPAFPPYFLQRSFRGTVEEAMDRATLVSFDIFDTLLRRPFLEPTHLFDALGDLHSKPQFGRERRCAEAQARNQHAAARDVTLDQIYARLRDNAALELLMEKTHLYPRPEMTAWLSLARAKGKTVVAVSDMYLPHAFIAKILDMHHLHVDDLIVSSHDSVAKWDGSAYRLLAARHGVPFADILHFGDNEGADYHAPVALGIPSVLVANKTPRGLHGHHLPTLMNALGSNGSHQGSMAGSVMRDVLCTEGTGPFWRDIGRYVTAPLMTGFAQWLDDEARHTGLNRVAFAARDGKMPREAFLALHGGNTIAAPYVHLSRSVVLRAGLDTRSEMVLYQLTSGIQAPVSDYVKRLGDGVDGLLAHAQKHFGGDPVVGRDVKAADLLDFFHTARDELAAIATKARPLLYRYLEQLDLLRDPSKVGIADIGWGGTAATVLWDAIPETRNWTWLYFGTRKGYTPTAANHRAMFFTYGIPSEHHDLVFNCVEIPEFLFSAPEPSSMGLAETPTGVQPLLAPEDSQWSGWAPRVSEMTAGFHDMLPHLIRRTTQNGLVIDVPTTATLLNHIIHSNDPMVIREFGQLQHQLGFGASRFEPLLPDDAMRYWSSILRLLKGRDLNAPSGRLYWKSQTAGRFLSPLRGLKLKLARKALRIHKRGGLFRRRKRR